MRPGIGRFVVGIILLCLHAGSAFAIDEVSADIGKSTSSKDDISLYRVNVQWGWDRRWFTAGDWFLGGYWNFGVSYWDGQAGTSGNSSLIETGFGPAFRLQRYQPLTAGMRPYLEFSVSVHLLSKNSIDNRDLGEAFQFGEYIGVGVRLGEGDRFDIGLRVQHFSNAGIGDSNDGLNPFLVHLGYHF